MKILFRSLIPYLICSTTNYNEYVIEMHLHNTMDSTLANSFKTDNKFFSNFLMSLIEYFILSLILMNFNYKFFHSLWVYPRIVLYTHPHSRMWQGQAGLFTQKVRICESISLVLTFVPIPIWSVTSHITRTERSFHYGNGESPLRS